MRPDRFYTTGAWKRMRLLVLSQEPLCRACASRGVDRAAAEVDHIVAMSEGGASLDRANLQPLCRSCRSRKTAPAGADGAGAIKPTPGAS
jgi:5-methylcytosine-specific restriction endonuclease McrA